MRRTLHRPTTGAAGAATTSDPISITTAETTAWVSGEIDTHTAPLLRDAGASILARRGSVRFDLRGVEFIDSSGLGVFVALTAAARDQGGDVVILRPSRPVTRLFEISGLESHLTIDRA